jgi:uracil-xanthine permease
MAIGWTVVHGGKTPPPGEAVAPDERLSWGRTVGLGAQHVVAMFGATFVFPLIMGLNAQLAIMMSGIATICFLLIVQGKVPSYLGTSASFVGGVAAIRAQGGDSADVTGAILVAGAVLLLVGVLIHFAGSHLLQVVLPPAVTGAVVMLIGFNLAPVVAGIYWPQDQWIAFATMTFVILVAVGMRGFFGRIAVFLGLLFGYILSWLADSISGPITSFDAAAGEVTTHDRVNWDFVRSSDWIGFPPHTSADVVGWHGPSFSVTFTLLVLPAVIALIAENTGHVKAVGEMTRRDLNPVMGRAIAADGFGTMVATSVGGSPTTTYAENIGVMAATRVYSTAAYYVAAVVAIIFGLSPKFGALVAATPGGVLGGITVVLYGMIGLLGAKIWRENGVDFGNPVNLVPLAAAIIIAIGNVELKISDNFSLTGIALGTLVAVVYYHLARAIAPPHLRDQADRGSLLAVGEPGMYAADEIEGHHSHRLDAGATRAEGTSQRGAVGSHFTGDAPDEPTPRGAGLTHGSDEESGGALDDPDGGRGTIDEGGSHRRDTT